MTTITMTIIIITITMTIIIITIAIPSHWSEAPNDHDSCHNKYNDINYNEDNNDNNKN